MLSKYYIKNERIKKGFCVCDICMDKEMELEEFKERMEKGFCVCDICMDKEMELEEFKERMEKEVHLKEFKSLEESK